MIRAPRLDGEDGGRERPTPEEYFLESDGELHVAEFIGPDEIDQPS